VRLRNLYIALTLCLAVLLSGESVKLGPYRNTDGNFTVLMPGTPTEKLTSDKPERKTHIVSLASGVVHYNVIYTKVVDDHTVSEEFFQIFRNAFLLVPECRAVNLGQAVPPVTSYLGRRYRQDCNRSGTMRHEEGNIYWGKRYSYVVYVSYPVNQSPPADLNSFLGSFAQIGPD